MIHELGKLTAGEKVPDHTGKRLGIDQLGRSNIGLFKGHAFTDKTLGTEQTGTALILQQFTDSTDTAGTEVVDIIHRTIGVMQFDQHFGGGDQIPGIKGTEVSRDIQFEPFVEFVTADQTQT